MARPRKAAQRDLLSRVSDLGSEVVHKLADVPGGARLMEMANESRSRLDEMQKKLRGLDELEKRVAKLERQLAAKAAKKPATTTARKASSSAKSAAEKATSPSRTGATKRASE